MSKSEKTAPPIVAAAEQINEAFASFERAARLLLKASLDSRRDVEAASSTLVTLTGLEGALMESLNALMSTISAMRDSQQKDANALLDRAKEIVERKRALDTLLERQSQLALDVRASAKSLEAARDAPSPDTIAAMLATIGKLIDESHGFATDAQAKGFTDLAAEGHGLRQQLLQVKNKAELMKDRLGKA
jgi:hypothetical protein